jgi:hypothetical protein
MSVRALTSSPRPRSCFMFQVHLSSHLPESHGPTSQPPLSSSITCPSSQIFLALSYFRQQHPTLLSHLQLLLVTIFKLFDSLTLHHALLIHQLRYRAPRPRSPQPGGLVSSRARNHNHHRAGSLLFHLDLYPSSYLNLNPGCILHYHHHPHPHSSGLRQHAQAHYIH